MKELRCIVFNETEVFRAIVDHRQKRRQPLPNGEVRRAQFREDPAVSVVYNLIDLQDNRSELAVDGTELTAALINFLMNRRIPVPRSARKNLVVIGSELAMTFELDDSQIPKRGHAGGRPPAKPPAAGPAPAAGK